MGIEFKFKLNQKVIIDINSASGKIHGQYVDRSGRHRFLVAYVAERGRVFEEWFDEQDLFDASPRPITAANKKGVRSKKARTKRVAK